MPAAFGAGGGVAATADVGRSVILATVGLLLLSVVPTATSLPGPGVERTPVAEPTGSVVCQGALPSTGVQGQLTIDGGPLPSNAAGGVPLNYTFEDPYRLFYLSNGTTISSGCPTFNGTTTTAANGSFSFVPEQPNDTCNETSAGEVCFGYFVPQAPVSVSLANGAPAGYVVSVVGWIGTIAMALVYELASVTIAPAGPSVTTSVGAPTTFTASAWAANGTATVLDPTLTWAVNGTGWSFDGPATGAAVRLVAVPSAGVGTLSVRASATVRGIVLAPVSSTVEVVAVPTEIETGSTNRTTLDVGEPLTAMLSAVGAEDFAYTAYVQPGLGLPAVPAPCASGSVEEGTVVLTCAATVSYSSAGTAQPTANVTNGYSTATWRFPDVTVTPLPELEVSPSSPVGYAMAPIPITVAAANDSGAPPYSHACLSPGSGPPACIDSAGPPWTFSPTYPEPGTFSATVWAVDAAGTNASTTFRVTVVGPLGVGTVTTARPNATVGAPVTLTANVSGGAFPLRYWWNASGVPGPLLDGELASDGPVAVTIVPNVSGPVDLTLTVVDRLGTAVASSLLLAVGPATAELVTAVTPPPAGAVTVGTPVELAWKAFDASGSPDRSFSTAAELTLTSPAGDPMAWVNASGAGPLASLGGGIFGVPTTAWLGGVLNVSVTVATATTVVIGLSGAGLPGPVVPLNLSVTPDLANVRLSAPVVVDPGARANATLWHVTDRFGNAAPGALLTIGLAFGGLRDDRLVAAVPLRGGGSGVWVNFSAPSSGSGELTVTDAAGAVILGPLAVPPAPAAPATIPPVDAVAAVVPLSAAGVATLVVVRHRRRTREAVPGEEELARLAEGRAMVVEIVTRSGAVDLAGIAAAWEPPPAPPDLAEWVASLVTDGTLGATLGADGKARFCLAAGAHAPPRPTVDVDALERSLRRRDEALGSDPEVPDGPDGPTG